LASFQTFQTNPTCRGALGLQQPGIRFLRSSAVTTNHVIERSKAIEISTDDGKSYPARLVSSDPNTDLALLKVEGAPAFPSSDWPTRRLA
jgi:hypothetical protein